jgi:hypothetical protein
MEAVTHYMLLLGMVHTHGGEHGDHFTGVLSASVQMRW